MVLLSPPANHHATDDLVFTWQPNTPLAPGQVYEVVYWRSSENENMGRSWRAASTETTARLYREDFWPPDYYNWGVWLGEFDSTGKYRRIRFLNAIRSFTISN